MRIRFFWSKKETQLSDQELIEQAYRESRILLTEDNDFGWLVFVSQARSAGVILIRYPGNLRAQLAQSVLELVREHGSALTDVFAVLQPGFVRLNHRPGRAE